MTITSGTDIARRFPDTAARLVANPEADRNNAWEVLVSAFGYREALTMVRAVDGGTQALRDLGVMRSTVPLHGIAFITETGLQCNCGAIESDLDAFHAHTVQTWNNPTPENIAARGRSVLRLVPFRPEVIEGHRIETCTKVACHNAGNARECVTLILTVTGGNEVRLFELDTQTAERIAQHGAHVNETHLYSFC